MNPEAIEHPARVCTELMRALRGQRSQVQFSRRLGYASNVAHTWESGTRFPTATTLIHAARRVGNEVEAGFRDFHTRATFLEHHDIGERAGIAAFLDDLRRDRPLSEVAARSGFSRFQIGRWLKGQADPRVPELLWLVEAMSGRMLDFVAIFVDPASLPSTAASWKRLEAARSLFLHYPRAQIVLLSLELSDYTALPNHQDAWLARRLGLPIDELKDLLERLADTGQIAKKGNNWAPAEVRTVDTRRHPEAGSVLRRWWWEAAIPELDAEASSISFNAFTVTGEERAAVIEAYRTAYRQMRAIVSASGGGDQLVLVQSGIVTLSEEAPDDEDCP